MYLILCDNTPQISHLPIVDMSSIPAFIQSEKYHIGTRLQAGVGRIGKTGRADVEEHDSHPRGA